MSASGAKKLHVRCSVLPEILARHEGHVTGNAARKSVMVLTTLLHDTPKLREP